MKQAVFLLSAAIIFASVGAASAGPDCSDPLKIQTSEDLAFCAQKLSDDKAQERSDWDDCAYADQQTAKVRACSRLIESKSISREGRIAAYRYRGMARIYEDIDGAIADFSRAISLDPNDAESYFERGNAYRGGKRKDLAKAIEDYTKVVAINPDNFNGYGYRAATYEEKGDLDRAIEDVSKELAIHLKGEKDEFYASRLTQTYQVRGRLYEKKEDFNNAISDFSRAIAAKGSLAETGYEDRGRVYGKAGDFKRAIDDTSKAIELGDDATPDTPFPFLRAELYFQRGRFLLFTANFAKALNDFNKAYEQSPGGNYLLWGELARRRSNVSSRLAEQARKLDADEWSGPIVQAFLGQQTIEGAIGVARVSKAQVQQDRLCVSYFYMGELALLRGQKADADRLLRAATSTCSVLSSEKYSAAAELKMMN